MTAVPRRVAIVGGGPAGLMAAESARAAGAEVDLYEAKGSVGRKFLIAGKGGLNLTHAEPMPGFAARYRERAPEATRWFDVFGPEAMRAWSRALGIDTFVGSSGRVFPLDLKAAPLLRGWVRRLREQGVRFHVHHRWTGWTSDGALSFDHAGETVTVQADAVVLALGGGSWPQLGSDGTWQPVLRGAGVAVRELVPSNCGFDVAWSEHFAGRHAGAPLHPVIATWQDRSGTAHTLQGECVVTRDGIEGSLVYAASAALREMIERDGHAVLWLDLVPGRDEERLQRELARPRGRRSASEHLRRSAGVEGVVAGLLREVLPAGQLDDADKVARTLKQFPLRLLRARPLAEAISSAGGVQFGALDADTLRVAGKGAAPVFIAGEMLDWEAPTGGYLLQASMATGVIAGRAAAGE